MKTLFSTLSYTPTELSFGTSGLRGLLTDMTDLECYINTIGFLNFLRHEQHLAEGEAIYVAGDLRESTPRILRSVAAAIKDSNFTAVFCGFIPTPTLAFYALQKQAACIMVTGSHIPADRNGIKFYKIGGEVLKDDESAIKSYVTSVREKLYTSDAEKSPFDKNGKLKNNRLLPAIDEAAAEIYVERYRSAFDAAALANKKIILYQHSAVGRDMIVTILQNLGAEVVTRGRSDIFIPIDSENVTPEDQAYFKKLATENPGLFAIVSTDGDSDRPFVIDENGDFHRGDELGAIVATWLKADFAAYSISTNDAVDTFLQGKEIPYEHTKIGSPYVIAAMQESGTTNAVGWETNGGFLLGTEVTTSHGVLLPLPTRDAVLPILVSLVTSSEASRSVSQTFQTLPQRFTSSGLIDNFPREKSLKILEKYNADSNKIHQELEVFFTPQNGFGKVREINILDGMRIYFDNGDIAHLRPSGNAPQLRIYSVADTQERANRIIELCISEPNGIFRLIEASLTDE